MKNSFVANHESWLVRCSPHAQGFNRNNLCDALVYLARPMHKKYSTTFFWSHPFSTYVSYERFRVTPFAYVISSILYSPLPFWLCSFAIVSSCCFTSRIDVFVSDNHHFLASHSVSSSLPRKALSLMVTVSYFTFHDRWRSLAIQM